MRWVIQTMTVFNDDGEDGGHDGDEAASQPWEHPNSGMSEELREQWRRQDAEMLDDHKAYKDDEGPCEDNCPLCLRLVAQGRL